MPTAASTRATIGPNLVDAAGADAAFPAEGFLNYSQTFDVDGAVLGAEAFAGFGDLRHFFSDCKYSYGTVTYPAAVTSGCTFQVCTDPMDASTKGYMESAGAITITGPHVADGSFTIEPSKAGTYFNGLPPSTTILWLPGDTALAVHANGAAFPAFDVNGFVAPSAPTSLTVNGLDALRGNPSFSRQSDLSLAFAGVTAGTTMAVNLGTFTPGRIIGLQCDFQATSATEVISKTDLQQLDSTTSGSFGWSVFSQGTVAPSDVRVTGTLSVSGSPQQTFSTTD
ncbi:MAG: hypothetical protein ABI551_04890 [Polyangiaceae bacterium]